MKKKYVMIGIILGFLILSGVCYSCSYKDSNAATVLSPVKTNNKEKEKEEINLQGNNLESSNYSVQSGEPITDSTTVSANTIFYIHICGAVADPGVYQVDCNARLIDLIMLAGGLSNDAAGDYINQAQVVSDGQRIYIPTKEEVKEITDREYIEGDKSNQENLPDKPELININEADEEKLMSLPGVGQAKADSIVKYRKTKGDFNTTEELMNVPGIKEGLFSQISSYITVNE